jgi:hypothetical protein
MSEYSLNHSLIGRKTCFESTYEKNQIWNTGKIGESNKKNDLKRQNGGHEYENFSHISRTPNF